ncbi:yippee-domain-containing protein [Lactarius akahatsu]|uniref:Protein yippee-like n=1 Tax=Lactarius akahatsu TaxID=416441 RepID=A0AAD4L6U5_9AGAM|nr:yippee-domain-containing protein [Lactarius akahatsu]
MVLVQCKTADKEAWDCLPVAPFAHVFEGHPSFCCSNCSAVIALKDELISKSFSGRDGRGYLMHSAVNVRMGNKEDRPLLTGVHTVADVFCVGCGDRLGWYYHKASDQSQKYKEGKYLLERERLVKDNAWTLEG